MKSALRTRNLFIFITTAAFLGFEAFIFFKTFDYGVTELKSVLPAAISHYFMITASYMPFILIFSLVYFGALFFLFKIQLSKASNYKTTTYHYDNEGNLKYIDTPETKAFTNNILLSILAVIGLSALSFFILVPVQIAMVIIAIVSERKKASVSVCVALGVFVLPIAVSFLLNLGNLQFYMDAKKDNDYVEASMLEVEYDKAGEVYYVKTADRSVTDVTIPKSYRAKPLKLADSCFENHPNIKHVTILSSDNIPRRAFIYCQTLETVVLNDDIENVGYNAFAYCPALREINIPTAMESAERLGIGFLMNCPSLNYLKEGNCLYLGNKNNPYFLLVSVRSNHVTKVTIHPDTKHIMSTAFTGCTDLEELVIPGGVITVQENAFNGVLKHLYVEATSIPAGWQITGASGVSYEKIHVFSKKEKDHCWHYVDGEPTLW